MKNNNKIFKSKLFIITFYIILFLVAGISIGFSSFVNSLGINDISAIVRVSADVRITSVEQNEVYGDAYSSGLDYNVNNINGAITLPNSDSYVDFSVKIVNLGNVEMGIANIVMDNEKLDYELLDYNLGDKLCIEESETTKCTLGIEKYIVIRVKWKDGMYDSENINNNFILDFDFENFYKVTVDASATDFIVNCPIEILNGKDLVFNYSSNKFNAKIYMNGVRVGNYTDNDGVITVSNVTGEIFIKYISYSLENGSFEVPTITTSYSYISSEQVVSWSTTSISNQIEVAKISNNKSEHLGVTSSDVVDSQLPDGNQFAEINANEKSTLFQNISVTKGETYNWNLYHRGRGGQEVMALIIGDRQAIDPSKSSKDSDDQFNAMVEWLFTQKNIDLKFPTKVDKYKVYSGLFNSSGGFEIEDDNLFSYTYDDVHTQEWDIWLISSSNAKWFEYSDSYVAKSDEIIFALCFIVSVKVTDLSYGNLIDNISFKFNDEEKIINGSFEDVDNSIRAYYHFYAENSSNPEVGIGWSTTAIDRKVEVGNFEKGKNAYGISKDLLSYLAYVKDGVNFIELNATETGTVYQDFLAKKDKVNEWSISHRGRDGIDYMAMIIGPSQDLNPSKKNASSKDQFMKMIDWIKNNIDLTNYGLDYANEGVGCSDKITLYSAKFSSLGDFEVTDDIAISLNSDSVHTEKWNIWIVGSNNDDWYTYGFYDKDLNYDNTYTNVNEKEETIIAFTNYATWGMRNGDSRGPQIGNLLDYIIWK